MRSQLLARWAPGNVLALEHASCHRGGHLESLVSHKGCHVGYGGNIAKVWLAPVNLASSSGFRNHELTKIRAIVIEHREMFLERWNEHFSN